MPVDPMDEQTGPSPLAKRSSHALAEKLFESSPDALIVSDGAGRIVEASAQVETLFGYTRSELLALPVETLIPEKLPAADSANGPQSAHSGEASTGSALELQAKHKDGTVFPIDVRLSSLKADGEALFLLVVRDITDRKQLEQILHRTEERFRLLVEGVKDYAIFMLDSTGRVTSWNSGAQNIKGYTAGEIIGQHFSKFYTLEDIQAGKPDYELTMARHARAHRRRGVAHTQRWLPFLGQRGDHGCS